MLQPAVRGHFNAINFSKILMKCTPYRALTGKPWDVIVGSNSDLYSASVTAVMYAIS